MSESERILLEHEDLDGCLVAELTGRLDSLNYAPLRDDLIKLALEEPKAVVACIDDLTVGSETLLSVFSSVSNRTSQWPRVPLYLVVNETDRRLALRHSAVSRFVPIFESAGKAVDAAESGPRRQRRRTVYPPVLLCSGSARAFVRETCLDWNLDARVADAVCIASELVENAIVHAGTEFELRLELRAGLLTIAVRDESPRRAMLRQGKHGQPLGYGLQIISDLAKAWGCSPYLGGGKITWATLVTGPRWFERYPAWPVP